MIHTKPKKFINNNNNDKKPKNYNINTNKHYTAEKKEDIIGQVNTLKTLKLYSTNAAGLTYGKMESFYKFIEEYEPNVISIQETHHKRKGKLRIDKFTIFESIRDKKGGGN